MATRRKRKRAVSVAPKRRRRRVARRVARRAVPAVAPRRRRRSRRNVMVSAPRRAHRRRSHRRYAHNPGMATGFLMDSAYVLGGFIGTRLAYGSLAPMVSGFLPVDQPLVRIAGKSAVAFGLGWAGKRFLGQRAGQLLLIGGMVEAMSDAVKTFVAPYVPALADDMSVYPSIGVYPSLGASGYDSPLSVSSYDEAV